VAAARTRAHGDAVRVIFLGPPGAGKGTQAARLAAHLGVPKISTGEMLRTAIANDTPLGREARPLMDEGHLVPDGLLVALIGERTAQADCRVGYVLDGFPRTLPQARGLEQMPGGDPRGFTVFDFVNPGLLGSAREFAAFAKRLAARPHRPFEPLRELVRPYVLRRLKTDRSVIADLPDKTEVRAFCALTRKQAALYQQAVQELERRLVARDRSDWQGRFDEAGVPAGAILDVKQAFEDPQVRHLGMAAPVPKPGGGELRLVGPAIRLSRTPARMKRAMGGAGEHNDEILRDLGYSQAEVERLRTEKVI